MAKGRAFVLEVQQTGNELIAEARSRGVQHRKGQTEKQREKQTDRERERERKRKRKSERATDTERERELHLIERNAVT